MEKHGQKSSLVLKYAKRRFDGGNEVELIRTIERQQTAARLEKLQRHSLEQAMQPGATTPIERVEAKQSEAEVQKQEPETQPDGASKKGKLLQACILGPMEISIGLVGIMTAGLAIFTFSRLNNQPLLRQSKGVFKDCLNALGKGLLDTVTTPIRVVKVATGRI